MMWNAIATLLYYLALTLPVIVGVLSLYYSLRFLKEARRIEDTPTSKIRSAAQGYVELTGRAEALPNQPPLYGKISNEDCVWYHYTIEQLQTIQTAEGPSSQYRIIEKNNSHDYFLLNDETGTCIVDPKGAEIRTFHEITAYGYATEPGRIYRQSLWLSVFGNTPQYRYHEAYIKINDPVYLKGVFKTYSHQDPILAQNPSVLSFCTEKNITSCSIVSKEDLPTHEIFLISAQSYQNVSRIYRLKSFLFLIVFLIFCYVSVNSFFPLVHKTWEEWSSFLQKVN